MDQFPEAIESAVRSFAEQERSSGSGHPEVDELVAYHAGELADQACEPLRNHLATCRECTRLLVDLASFPKLKPPTKADRISEAEVKAQKAALKIRLEEEGLRKPTSAGILAFRRPARASIPAAYWTAMAALLVVAVGLGVWGWIRPVPGADTELFLLFPESERDAGEEIRTFEIPVWADYYLLVLGSARTDRHSAFRAEIVDSQGRLVLRDDALHRSYDGTVKWRLGRDRLAAGSYEIRLFGLGAGPPEPLGSYAFRIALDAAD